MNNVRTGSLSPENLLMHVSRGAQAMKTARNGNIMSFRIAHARSNAPSFPGSKYNYAIITFLLTQQIVIRV